MAGINNNEFDVIIIGGGITGAGTARDCSLRGLKVLLMNGTTLRTELPDEIMDCCTAAHVTP